MPVRTSPEVLDELFFEGTDALAATIKATAVEDLGTGRVRFQAAAVHGFVATEANPIMMEIEGTTNYDGVRRVVNISATDKFDIVAAYVAETPAGTETIKFNIRPLRPFEFASVEITFDSVPTTSEDFTMNLDSHRGSSFDTRIRTKDLSTISSTAPSWAWRVAHGDRESRDRLDRIKLAYTNTDGNNIAIKVRYGILS